ncbi:MAG: (d)CMP kinase [Magnetococcales bacterium]|nr:(d)CMP kinase [Magnetococcales bacterium]
MITKRTPLDRLVVAVDGPAGAGKGAVCRWVALQYDFEYLDTGAIYRAVALLSLQHGGLADQPDRLATMAREMAFVFSPVDGRFVASLDGADVTLALRQETVSMEASRVAALGPVRSALLDFQRNYGGKKNILLDGRDIGTVVWPEAQRKIFLTASLEERAKRRALELQEKGETVSLPGLLAEMKLRDARDMARAHAPMVPADDAIIVDTTFMTLEESQHQVAALIAPLYQER